MLGANSGGFAERLLLWEVEQPNCLKLNHSVSGTEILQELSRHRKHSLVTEELIEVFY